MEKTFLLPACTQQDTKDEEKREPENRFIECFQ